MAQVLSVFLMILSVLASASAANSNAEADPPAAFSPSEAPMIRKLGKHHLSPSEAPVTSQTKESSIGTEEIYLEKDHHGHHSVDKSVAGGGVILGGVVTAFAVSVFCYIRATRRRSTAEPPTPTTTSSV